MWRTFNLRTRIYLLLAGLAVISLSSGGVMMWYTYRIQGLFSAIIDRNITAYASAAALQTALVNQKGYVTYYFLDGDPKWLQQFDDQREIFNERLIKARRLPQSKAQLADLERIADEYKAYMQLKDRVIAYYKKGERAEGALLHRSVRLQFFNIIELCENYKLKHFQQILQTHANVAQDAARLRIATLAIITIQMILVMGLGVFLVHQILVPVYQMLKNTTRNSPPNLSGNIISTLGSSVNNLLRNVDEAQQELEKSRENLLQAEKMAMVGRLAAGMAHSIRNPFTSVKMRLFSLNRSLELNAAQNEDFEVISEEIRHIDTIVQNFLEFSRPPKLVMQPISPSAIVDNALQLLSHRLDSYGVAVEVVRSTPLPEVMADPEQLKEVLVNLIINACEEMKNGGSIIINEAMQANGGRTQAMLYVSDSGLGVSASNVEKIFQPFFTTKDEGTGLGLSIARRIVDEHGGTLTLDTEDTTGATFVIGLPVKEPSQ